MLRCCGTVPKKYSVVHQGGVSADCYECQTCKAFGRVITYGWPAFHEQFPHRPRALMLPAGVSKEPEHV